MKQVFRLPIPLFFLFVQVWEKKEGGGGGGKKAYS
jgi:hypothetical protein